MSPSISVSLNSILWFPSASKASNSSKDARAPTLFAEATDNDAVAVSDPVQECLLIFGGRAEPVRRLVAEDGTSFLNSNLRLQAALARRIVQNLRIEQTHGSHSEERLDDRC